MLKQKKEINERVAMSLEAKTVLCVDDLFKLIKQIMQYVEKYKMLSGIEKRDIIYDNVSTMIYKTHTIESAPHFVCLIIPFIEALIQVSNSKLLINIKRGCITKCI